MASEEWRPAGPAVCRCCFAEGCYKDISSEYFWMGKKEVYADMLNETFNINISHSKWSGPSSTSRLICEACIARLRDAAEFKKQVVECEKTFMQHLDPATSSLQPEVECEVPAAEVKLEGVKVEKLLEDEDDFDNRMGFDDDDEDMDQPLVSLASKVPKKEQINVLDLLKGTEVVVKKKKSVMRAKEPLQKVKVKKVVRPAAPPKPDKAVPKKKEHSYGMSSKGPRRNAWIIVENSTAYPFRLPEDSVVCVYCCDKFEDPSHFRDHMRSDHASFNVKVAFLHLHEGQLKVDCWELSCRVCGEPFDDLESVALHLNNTHRLDVDFGHDLGLLPFKLQRDLFSCAVCGAKSICLRQLSRHTQGHFSKFTCEMCAKSYATITALNHHVRYTHVIGEAVCRKCKRAFGSRDEKRKHLLESARCWPHLCTSCGERFFSWELKQLHLVRAHGLQKRRYTCHECGLDFDKRHKYRAHFILSHTDSGFGCPCCSLKFGTRRELEQHRVVHTKEKLFPCTVCDKCFARKKNLVQHMWVHSEHKRFECKMCNKKFNQRVSWKTHMRSYHADLVEIDIDASKTLGLAVSEVS